MSKDAKSGEQAKGPGEALAEASVPGSPIAGGEFAIASRGDPGPAELAAPADQLAEFFYREDEPSSPHLQTGMAALPRRDPGPAPDERREYLTFMLGAEEFGFDIAHAREVLKAPPITEVPRAPPHILGVITVRGEVIAVVDPRRRLSLPPPGPNLTPRVIVCDAGEGPCGLLVDAVSQVVRLSPSSIEPRPSGIGDADTGYITAIGRDRERLIVLLDAGLLLARPTPGREATP